MRELSKDEFEQKIIEISRVTRVQAGGKRMRFRACVVIGDKKGRIGLGIKKGADVSIAVNKAVTAAKRNLIKIKMINDTISHTIIEKFCGAEVFLKPAPAGRGVIAGGPVRAVLELAGIKNVVSKMQGSKNKINNVRATINALTNIRTAEEIKKLRQTD
ncbi:MAG: 30S ribosomal protein S5 [Candidatus Kerfeldbacteria bacterium CG_4_10_14_0_8_um_filter_42_10]|uniref:Small ribosomal subunit protein uS5 n=1 Tax=Candidatus Kerfeldbacteria bacterium CG_4_10_14_0_8_um_filter_42_10 TaxID=2014248 RepID=A0A2M7RIT6_9BACT|nr:MAG: 30S ribosomal protein S5 [Candidatus Kerfeldbacteria bacterium CG_4_10_14_0_8_um_filter_42_10]